MITIPDIKESYIWYHPVVVMLLPKNDKIRNKIQNRKVLKNYY
jgi:hypothetical protein